MQALIIVNSQLPLDKRLAPYLDKADLILCADGGANHAVSAGLQPDFVIGDLDSVNPELQKKVSKTKFIRLESQYATDLEKTLQFAADKNVDEATVVGVSGGRLDHQVCNLNILEKFSDRLKIALIDDTGIGFFVRDHFEFTGVPGQQVSIFAFRKADGITTRGLKYPILNGSMEWAVNDGLSNEVVDNPVRITLRKGILFVFCVWSDYFVKKPTTDALKIKVHR